MLTGIVSGVIAVIVGLVLWFTRKAGGDSARASAATEALKDVTEANRAVSVDERGELRKQYKRD